MTLLQQQAFHTYFQLLGETVLKWYEDRPNNTELKNILKCVNEIGMFTHFLITENKILEERVKLLNSERFELSEQIEELWKLKQITNE